ncbi:torsin-1B-like isoform X2 [Hyla sarda]|nr:torsin-1B-like isoform X2 [Hyla sarda]XP_056394662.1 torsin-1B-like isoform X2 [Hyla sarda]
MDFLTPPCDRLACYTTQLPRSYECCNKEGKVNITGVKYDLDTKVFGQHLAEQVILKVMEDENRLKPLVLSFHGLTGSGKTFITQILAKHFNPMGKKSRFVRKIVTTASFPHVGKVEEYKDQLHAWIRGNVSRCERSLFIFDDSDKMHPELLHSLKPYLDNHDHIDGVSYKKSIFIFISNTGANVISDFALEFRKEGKKREEIQLFELQSRLSSYLQKSLHSEYHNSDLINNNVIDVFVPFLPLELEHVKMCVRAELQRLEKTEDKAFVDRIAGSMDYYPREEKVFSQNGCKNVAARIKLL